MIRAFFVAFLLLLGACTSVHGQVLSFHGTATVSACTGDGLSGAPSGTPQHASLLLTLPDRSGCAVAGVDYRAGPSSSQVFKLPTDGGALPSGVTYDPVTHNVRCDGTDGKVIDGVDFATGGASFNITGGCNNLTIKNSKIREFWEASANGCMWAINQDTSNSGITLTNVEVDGNGEQGDINCAATQLTGETIYLRGSGNITLDYVWVHDVDQHFYSFGGPAATKHIDGSITGTLLTVTAVVDGGPLAVGDAFSSFSIETGTKISAFGTGTGGTGTYTVSISQPSPTGPLTNVPIVAVGPFSTISVTHGLEERCGYSQGGHCNGSQFTGAQIAAMTWKWNTFYDPQPDTAWTTAAGQALFVSGSNSIDLTIADTNQSSFRQGQHVTGTRFAGTAILCTSTDNGSFPVTATITIGTDATCTTPVNASSSGTGQVTVTDMWPIGITIPVRYVWDGYASNLGPADISRNTFVGFGPVKGVTYNIACDGTTAQLTLDANYYQAANAIGMFNLAAGCPNRAGTGATEMATGAHTAVP